MKKRILSSLLCICMLLSLFSGFGFSVTFAASALDGTDYANMFDSSKDAYANTLVILPGKTMAAGQEYTFTFAGKEVTETYVATRHFASFADAMASWESRYTGNALATTVPNIILTAGTYADRMQIKFSANIYGAKAGITPNDPNFSTTDNLPTQDWGTNPLRNGTDGETVISGGILRSNKVNGSTSDTTIFDIRKAAGVKEQILNIDGVKFTSTCAIEMNDLAKTSDYITQTVNVKNTIMSGNTNGFFAENDGSHNFNDYYLTEVLLENITGDFVESYQRKIVFDRVNMEGCKAIVTSGKVDQSDLTKNSLWWTSCGGDRSYLVDIKNSRIANGKSAQFIYNADNSYLLSNTIKFDSSMLVDASTNTWGLIAWRTHGAAGSGYAVPQATFTNNTIYSSAQKSNLFNGTHEWYKGPINFTVTGNRIIGYKHPVININADSMVTTLSGSKWVYDNNYYCPDPANFTSAADFNGTKPTAYNTDMYNRTKNFVDLNLVPYYLDYSKQYSTEDFKITGASFFEDAVVYDINQSADNIMAIIREDQVWDNITFTHGAPKSTTVKIYSDSSYTTEVTSISEADVGSGKTYYVKLTFGTYTRVYTLDVLAETGSIVVFKDSTPALPLKNTAALLTTKAYNQGDEVIAMIGGQLTKFVYGENAFSTVNQAIAKGITQMVLMPVEYNMHIDIGGSIELYGDDYLVNPNRKYAQPETPWELADAWKDGTTKLTGNIRIRNAATPQSDAGTKIYISGVELSSAEQGLGRLMDTERGASNYATDITLENVYFNIERDVGHVLNLSNSNANNTNASYTNIDSFTIKNSRINNQYARQMSNNIPGNVTFDGVFFCEKFAGFGYPQYQKRILEGTFEFKNNFFYKFKGTDSAFAYIEGHSRNIANADVNANMRFEFNNNIMLDCTDDKTNDGASGAWDSDLGKVGSKYFINIAVGAYRSINITGNKFIDTQNLFGHLLYAQNIADSTTGEDINSNKGDLSEKLTVDGNSFVGTYALLYTNEATVKVNGTANYYSRYAEGYNTANSGERMFAELGFDDYYIDYNCTVKASDIEMVSSKSSFFVDNLNRKASIIIGKNETYYSDLRTKSLKNSFLIYTDKECTNTVTSIKASDVGDGRKYYAKVAYDSGAYAVYELYVTVGDENAALPETVGAANIASPYLFDLRVAQMTKGTKFTTTFEGTEYLYTAGVNAFSSISQITNYHNQFGQGTPNVIMPEGAYSGNIVITDEVNIYGENGTEVKQNFDTTSPVKIVCIGDSTTEGMGITASQRYLYSYPAQLQTKLDAKYGENKFYVFNAGWGGSTVNIQTNRETRSYDFWTYEYTARYYQALDLNPDIVVIKMGYNDTNLQFYTTPEIYKKQYQKLIDSFRALPSSPTIVVAGSIPGTNTGVRKQLLEDTIIPLQKELAKENNALYIDSLSVMKQYAYNGTKNDEYFTDNIHCTAKGYGVVAEYIMNGMEPILSTSRTVNASNVTVNTLIPDAVDKIKVACVGDSFTYGDMSYGGYPIYLQKYLGNGYEVRNFGENGASLLNSNGGTLVDGNKWSYDLKSRGQASFEWDPDVVIITLGTNDCGSNVMNYHGLSWSKDANGNTVDIMQSTGAAEFLNDYGELIEQYKSQGATRIICSTNPKNNTLTSLIQKAATDNGVEFMNTYATSGSWSGDLMSGTNKNGVNDGHFSNKGYEKYGKLVAELAFGDFATYYFDNEGEISRDAVVVDVAATGKTNGQSVSYNWEGMKYNFVWGQNAFASLQDAINATTKTDLDVLIPENTTVTTANASTYALKVTSMGTVTNLEVYGQNRKFDPNDKTPSSKDPAADWPLSSMWDSYSVSGGTSAVGNIQYANATGVGTLKFKGLTMRGSYIDTTRTTGDISVTIENTRVDWTAQTTSVFLQHGNGHTKSSSVNRDYFMMKNVRMDGLRTTGRLLQQNTPSNYYWHGVYLKPSVMPGVSYQLASNGAPSATMEIIGCNFRENARVFSIAPADNEQKVNPSVVVVKDNVYYNTPTVNAVYPWFTTDLTIEGNYYVFTTGTSKITYANGFDTNNYPITSADFADKVNFTAKNNTFLFNTLSRAAGFTINSNTAVDMTGTYYGVYDENYVNGIKGTAPAFGGKSHYDYYYLDYLRTVKNTDIALKSLSFEDEVDSLEIGENTVNVSTTAGKVFENVTGEALSPSVNVEFFADANCTQKVTDIDLSSVVTSSVNYFIKLSFGDYTKVYTLSFVLGTPDAYEGDEIAIIPDAAGLENGAVVLKQWNGIVYSFTVGENAFASFEALKEAHENDEITVIMPAGKYSGITVYGPWTILGEDHATNPNVIDGDSASLNSSWGIYGQTIIENGDVVIAAEAEGATIAIKGIRMTKRFLDTARPVSALKTAITLENIVFDSKYRGSDRDFNMVNANSSNTDKSVPNIDEFTLRNIHYIDGVSASNHALFQEKMAPILTIDGFCAPDGAVALGYPKACPAAAKVDITFENNFFKGLAKSHSHFKFVASFVGHDNATVDDASRDSYDTSIKVLNNTFVNASDDIAGAVDTGVIQIFPKGFKKIVVKDNTVVSTTNGDGRFIAWMDIAAAKNDDDFSDRITYTGNKLIGVTPEIYVNDLTTVDHSNNYYAFYTTDYAEVANGMSPAKTGADYYLDFDCTVLKSSLVPEGFGYIAASGTLYTTSVNDTYALALAKDGVTYQYFSDKDCNNAITSVAVADETLAKVYVRAIKGNVSYVFTLYIAGIESADALSAEASDMAVYYPSAYGVPAGIDVYAKYDGTYYKFTTGKTVVGSPAEFAFTTKTVVIPDSITELDIAVTKCTPVVYKEGSDINISLRKMKIATVGDSITEGYHAADRATQSYPAIIQKTLGTEQFELSNFGLSSATVQLVAPAAERKYTIYAKTKYDASIAYNPDVVIFALGTNDLYASRWSTNDNYIKEYRELIESYQALESKPMVIMTTAIDRYDDNTLAMRLKSNLVHIQSELAGTVGGALIDTHEFFKPYVNATYLSDSLHPTTEGHRLMGEFIAGEMVDLMGTATPLTHVYDIPEFDEGYHWNNCQCGLEGEKEAHYFDGTEDKQCNACEFVRGEDHYDLIKKNDEGHWTECICGDAAHSTPLVPHDFENGCDELCETCGYTRETEHNCKVTDDGTYSYYKCIECDEVFHKAPYYPLFSEVWTDPLIPSDALLVNSECYDDEFFFACTWDGKTYNFIKDQNAFNTYEAAVAYAQANNIEMPSFMIKNWNGYYSLNVQPTMPGNYFTQNWNKMPYIKGTEPDGSDWTPNIGTGAGQFNTANGFMSRYFNFNKAASGEYNIYGWEIQVSIETTASGITSNGDNDPINIKFENTYINKVESQVLLYSGLNAQNAVNDCKTSMELKNSYLKNPKGYQIFHKDWCFYPNMTFDGVYADYADVNYPTNAATLHSRAKHNTFIVRNCNFRNVVPSSSNYIAITNSSIVGSAAAGNTGKVIFDNNIFYNYYMYNKNTAFARVDLPYTTELTITNNRFYSKSANNMSLVYSSSSGDKNASPMKLTVKENFFNGINPTLNTYSRTLTADSVIEHNYTTATYATAPTANGVAFTNGTLGGAYYVDAAMTRLSNVIYPMTFNGAAFDTNGMTVSYDAQGKFNMNALIDADVNVIEGYLDAEMTQPADLANVFEETIYLKVYSYDRTVSQTRIVNVTYPAHEQYYEKNDDGHWLECTCGQAEHRGEATAHNFDNACDKICDTCGYERVTEHDYQVVSEGSKSYYKCIKCNDVIHQSDYPLFSATFEDEVLPSDALLIDNKVVNSEFFHEATWDGVTYAFVKGENAFASYADATAYANSKSMTMPSFMILNINGSTVVGGEFHFTTPGNYFTQNWNKMPYTKGKLADGSDWASNIGTGKDQFNPANGLSIGYVGLTSTIAGQYNIYGLEVTKSIAAMTTMNKDAKFKFENLYANKSGDNGQWFFYYNPSFCASTSNSASATDTLEIKNAYITATSSYNKMFHYDYCFWSNFIWDGVYSDMAGLTYPAISAAVLSRTANTSFVIRNSNLRNVTPSSTTYFKFHGAAYTGNTAATSSIVLDNNIFYNYSMYNTSNFLHARLDYLTELTITNNRFYNKFGNNVNLITSANTGNVLSAPLKLTVTGNFFDGFNSTFNTYSRTLSNDSVVEANYVTSTYAAEPTATGVAFTNGTLGKTGYYLDAAMTKLSSDVHEMTFDGKDFGETVNYNVSSQTSSVDLESLIGVGYNSVEGYLDESLSIPTALNNVTVAATGSRVYVKVYSADKSSYETRVINVIRADGFTVGNTGLGSSFNKTENDTTYNWLSWRGVVNATGSLTFKCGQQMNHRVGVIYFSELTKVNDLKAAILAEFTKDGTSLSDADAIIDSINASVVGTENITAKAYVMSANKTFVWDCESQSYGYRYNFSVPDEYKRGAIMYAVYEGENGLEVTFSDMVIQKS